MPNRSLNSDRRPRTDTTATPRRVDPPPAGTARDGMIKRIIADRGFCFVRDDDGVEYFLHSSELPLGEFALLTVGSRVRFVVADSDKGPRAEQAERL